MLSDLLVEASELSTASPYGTHTGLERRENTWELATQGAARPSRWLQVGLVAGFLLVLLAKILAPG